MPSINLYRCNKCNFALPMGDGGYLYVENDQGERIVCPHPAEMGTIVKVLGERARCEFELITKGLSTKHPPNPSKLLKERTGFNSHCACLDCLHQFESDLGDEGDNFWRNFWGKYLGFAGKEKDKRECPSCMSHNVKTLLELVDNTCPKCKDGLIKEIETGMIS